MCVRVEFYGIPRQRAGTATVDLPALVGDVCLGDVVRELATRYPELAQTCFDGDRLRPGYVANLGGERFVQDPRVSIPSGVPLLVMSAEAGG